MTCDEASELLSGLLDDELTEAEQRQLSEHVAACPDCVKRVLDFRSLHAKLRMRSAEDIPDLTASILARTNPPQLGWAQWIRYALAWVALAQVAFFFPALVLGSEAGASTHVSRHLGSMGMALALGWLYAAWRPNRAFGLLPIAFTLGLAYVVTAIVDVSDGSARSVSELHHVLDVAGVVLLWLLAGSPRPDWLRRRRSR